MKKLIAISVVFALLATTAVFAADLSGQVIGGVVVVGGTTAEGQDDMLSGGGMKRLRFETAGENGEGTFGAWMRFESEWAQNVANSAKPIEGYAWWKPLDQFKLIIGSFSDGFWEQAGHTRWMFYQQASDTVVVDVGNAWYSNFYSNALSFSNIFYGGYSAGGLAMEIKPVDIVSVNIGIPFIAGGGVGAVTNPWGPEEMLTKEAFQNFTAQVAANLDFGTIAFTYDAEYQYDAATDTDASGGDVYVYFGLSAIEGLGLDIGLGTGIGDLRKDSPIYVGVGAQYDINAEFKLKARVGARVGGADKAPTFVLADILPIYAISDDLKAAVSVGLAVCMPDQGDTLIGWHFNPYLQVGADWGPLFLAGIRVWSEGDYALDAKGNSYINWAIPIALTVSF